MDNSAGLDLLLAGLRARFGEGRSLVPLDPPSEVVSAALSLARDNKLLLMVAGAFEPLLGSADRAGLVNYKLETMAHNTGLLHELVRINRRMRQQHIHFVAIKGPLQQSILYGNYFARPASDVDLLVADSDYLRSIDAIKSLSYEVRTTSVWWRQFLGEQHLVRRGAPAPSVDLHFRLQQPGSPAPRSPEQFLSHPATVDFLGEKLPFLSAPNVSLLCALSAIKALFNREFAGAHICDLFVSLKAGAPEAINSFLTHAGEQRVLGTALAALRIVGATFERHFSQLDGSRLVLAGIDDRDLLRMIFTPNDEGLRWPRRRDVLWELCRHQPLQFAREAGRAYASEFALRRFERP